VGEAYRSRSSRNYLTNNWNEVSIKIFSVCQGHSVHTMKSYGGSESMSALLTSSLAGGQIHIR
jgi:hypothetical protein